MLVLSILALLLLTAQTLLPSDSRFQEMFWRIDYVFCGFFFLDFLLQLFQTESRKSYLKWGWLDLLSSIPVMPQFRIARVARLIRIIRVLRAVRASKQILEVLHFHRSRNALGAVVFGSVVLLLCSMVAIISFEPSLSSSEAFWWSIFTLITGKMVGYYPETTEGRIVALMLMTAGVAIFGTFTATLASRFIEYDKCKENSESKETAVPRSGETVPLHTVKGEKKDD